MPGAFISRETALEALQGRGAPFEFRDRLAPPPGIAWDGDTTPSQSAPSAAPLDTPEAQSPFEFRDRLAPPPGIERVDYTPPSQSASTPTGGAAPDNVSVQRSVLGPGVLEALAGTARPIPQDPLTQQLLGMGTANNPAGMDPLGRQRMRMAFMYGNPTQQAAAGAYLRGGAGDDAARQQNRLAQGVNLESQRRRMNEERRQSLVGNIADLIDARGGAPIKNEHLGEYVKAAAASMKRYEDPKNEYGADANYAALQKVDRMMRDERRIDNNLDQLVLGGPLGMAANKMFEWFSDPRQEIRLERQNAFLMNLDKYFPGNISQREIEEAKASVPGWADNPVAWAAWRRKIIGYKIDEVNRRISAMKNALRVGPDGSGKYHTPDEVRKMEHARQRLLQYENALTDKIQEISGMNRPVQPPGRTLAAGVKAVSRAKSDAAASNPFYVPMGMK